MDDETVRLQISRHALQQLLAGQRISAQELFCLDANSKRCLRQLLLQSYRDRRD